MSTSKSALNNANLGTAADDAINNIPNLGEELQNAMGIQIDDVEASEVVLVAMLMDDSGSIRFEGNSQIVCDGHNLVIDAVTASKQGNGILAMTKYLNGTLLFPWTPIDQVVKMDSNNFNANGGTPLYDQTATFLALVAAKAEEFEQNAGIPVRSISLIVTDGADIHSQHQSAKSVASIVKGMLKSEKHIIAGLGISDGQTDFNYVFQEMGVPKEWILTPAKTDKEIRAAFNLFSKSAVRQSQNGAGSMGGFSN